MPATSKLPPRVLFVDDDQMLLSSMERCLGLKFDLETAISGPEALRKMEESKAFSVVVSDMRMPVMNGVQFIERARVLSPHTVFLMLTGNQDVQTAISAVNEGQVFRFLNKPIDPADIAAVIEAAHQQHQLEASERELLNKTFVGAVGIFADVMETLRPELLSRAAATEEFVEQLREQIGAPGRWEFKMASKLSLVGQAMHPGSANAPAASKEAIRQLGMVCDTSAKMVEKIPRMDLVSQIIRSVPSCDADLVVIEPRGDGDVVQMGAALLRVANLVESMSQLGVDIDDAERDIQKLLPNIHQPLLAAARAVYPLETQTEGVPVDVDDLKPGMVLHSNLQGRGGSTLLRAGRRLSETHIEKLRADKQSEGEMPPVIVTVASFRGEYGEPAIAK